MKIQSLIINNIDIKECYHCWQVTTENDEGCNNFRNRSTEIDKL